MFKKSLTNLKTRTFHWRIKINFSLKWKPEKFGQAFLLGILGKVGELWKNSLLEVVLCALGAAISWRRAHLKQSQEKQAIQKAAKYADSGIRNFYLEHSSCNSILGFLHFWWIHLYSVVLLGSILVSTLQVWFSTSSGGGITQACR